MTNRVSEDKALFQDGGFGGPSQKHTTPPEKTVTRRLLVVLLDTSGSMGLRKSSQQDQLLPIQELAKALDSFIYNTDFEISQFGRNGEIAIANFWGEDPGEVHWFHLVTRVSSQSNIFYARYIGASGDTKLTAEGGTPMGYAVERALDEISKRLKEWYEEGLRRDARPALVLLTDGEPTDDIRQASERVKQMEDQGDLAFWIATTKSATKDMILPLAPRGNIIDLADRPLDSFVMLMSISADATAGRHKSVDEIYANVQKKWNDLEAQYVAGS